MNDKSHTGRQLARAATKKTLTSSALRRAEQVKAKTEQLRAHLAAVGPSASDPWVRGELARMEKLACQRIARLGEEIATELRTLEACHALELREARRAA